MSKFLALVALGIGSFAVAGSASAFTRVVGAAGFQAGMFDLQTQTELNDGYQSYAMVPNFYGSGRHNPASNEFGAGSER